ncbi:cytidine deaminase [Pseudoflavonifractor sp. MSJ-30]|uniref:cytidine deaminase n=1 Tax=Pseudoflavonifractor sp. MSJ-30 TaxID=2841525 RepID=UPI001C123F5F|nr:cytidine deaminase [Pseudoflavonifractor sp. MSJ-30]MBU5452295.1 cytidine deaminase [Pseudoflavonifractor sp. MSJ-30]
MTEASKLASLAIEAMSRAYAPYSGYKVGAALLCADGAVYQGCNIENGSYGATNCAERTAFFKAVYDGHREFTAIAVCGGKDGVISDVFPPCGICRQVMREFCADDFRVYLVGKDGVCTERTLSQILPDSFRPQTHMQK